MVRVRARLERSVLRAAVRDTVRQHNRQHDLARVVSVALGNKRRGKRRCEARVAREVGRVCHEDPLAAMRRREDHAVAVAVDYARYGSREWTSWNTHPGGNVAAARISPAARREARREGAGPSGFDAHAGARGEKGQEKEGK